jgi:hypothetical protein
MPAGRSWRNVDWNVQRHFSINYSEVDTIGHLFDNVTLNMLLYCVEVSADVRVRE